MTHFSWLWSFQPLKFIPTTPHRHNMARMLKYYNWVEVPLQGHAPANLDLSNLEILSTD